MTRDIVMTVYPFEELDSFAQEHAHSEWLSTGLAWSWCDEWLESMNAFCDIAPISFIRSDIAARHVDVAWSDDYGADISGVRAWKWLINNGWHDLAIANAAGSCTLTGYCGDCPPFDVIKVYCESDPRNVPSLEQVFYEAAQSWVNAACEDMEACETEEYFAEHCEGNEFEFDKNGVIQ